MIYGSDRWFALEHTRAREFARAAGWRCAACGRKIRDEFKPPGDPWTSLLPSWQPVHLACVPPLSMHDLRETWGAPAADWWLRSPFLPDLRSAADLEKGRES